jgi:ketosteroid isomerase-like protein
MSPDERVRSWWESPDHEALVAACDPGVEWDLRRFEGWDGEPVQRGHEGVRAVLQALSWSGCGTCIASGDKVLVDAHDDDTSSVVHELRGERIVRLMSITDRWEAQLALTGTDPLAVVRGVWQAWEARDMERVLAFAADDIVFDLSHYDAWIGAARYEGLIAMIGFLAEWMSWWDDYHQQAVGDELYGRDVLLSVRHGGHRAGQFVEEEIVGLVYAVRADGRINYWTIFPSPEQARAWIELRQAPAEAQ